jgi:pimeloyl-ACP methyl ester carboxylesterase
MSQSLPLVLVPGLLCSARLFTPQVEALWAQGAVTVADHRRDPEIGAVAQRILDGAPPRFALAGLSYGGYIAFAMLRLAPERIGKLALLDTSARPDTPEQSDGRVKFIAMAEAGKLDEVVATLTPRFVHSNRRNDAALMTTVRAMAAETGPDAFVRQQKAIMSRQDSRPLLSEIGCPTLVLVGDGDELTTPELAREIAGGIAGSRLVVVPNCGHLSTIERPEPVNAALTQWLAA